MLLEKVLVIFKKFWKFKIWLIGIPVLSGALVFFLTRNQERKYISKATLQVSMPTSGDVSLIGREFKQYEASLFFFDLIEVINSRKTTEMVRLEILKKYMEGEYQFFSFDDNPELREDSVKIYNRAKELGKEYNLLNLSDSLDIGITLLLENNRLSIKEMQGQLNASRVGKSNYVDIKYECENPYKAAYITGCYINIITQQYKVLSQKKIEDNRERLEVLVDNAKKELDSKISQLENFKIENNIINLPEHTKAIVNQVVNMEVKLAHLKETYDAHDKAAEIVKKNLQNAGSFNFNDISNKTIASLKDSLRNVSESLLFFEGDEIEKQELETKVEHLKNEITAQIITMLDKVPYDPSQARQELMSRLIGYEIDKEMESSMLESVENELEKLNLYAAKFAPLESSLSTYTSEIHIAQEAYLILLNKLNLVRTIEQGSGDVKITIFSPPILPREPESSKRAFAIVGACIASFILIAAGIVAFVLLDKRVYSTSYFTELTTILPFISINDKSDNIHEIKRLRKKISDLPNELRTILIIGLSEKDIDNSFLESLMQSLATFPGNQLMLNATGSEKTIEGYDSSNLPEKIEQIQEPEDSKNYVINIDNKTSPFEKHHPEFWQEYTQKSLISRKCIIIAAPPALLSSDWEEWLSTAHAFILVRMGGQGMTEKDKDIIRSIYTHEKSFQATVFIEKEQ
ncbi:GumC family protein [Chondrinema litorale]|uniref:GumC family protein n=1 Tax=Chondrinema litorale TaxID=2994555 RepID=UPI00254370A3|nr:hypothetical protein [Chondrinema litorale]UZR98021.1 hypothetical protein OQ292_28780 [Chondrinema litorale]